MSVEAMALVLHHSKAKGTDKVVLLGIANHDGDGGAWPSVETLAKYANVSENAVRVALRRLEALGEVQTYRNAGGTHSTPSWKRPNRYDVLVSCPITCDRTKNHRLKRLPEAPADLWIDPPSSTRGPLTDAPSDPSPSTSTDPSPTRGEPSLEPPIETDGPGSASTTGRASSAPCSVCGKGEVECQRRRTISGHDYSPTRRTA